MQPISLHAGVVEFRARGRNGRCVGTREGYQDAMRGGLYRHQEVRETSQYRNALRAVEVCSGSLEGNLCRLQTVTLWTKNIDKAMIVKAKMYAISSDTHRLQFLKLHHFKLEII